MKDIIKNIDRQIVDVCVELNRVRNNGREYGSVEQTRDILLSGIYQAAIDNLKAARNQLSLLDKELF